MDECVGPELEAQIREAVTETYRAVAREPVGQFCYPVGRESAEGLGYEREWLDAVPAEVVDRFVGVGNPFGLRQFEGRERVLDVGCGAGLDTLVAAMLVGRDGRSVGVDIVPEMLEWPRKALATWELANVEFREGAAEDLPFEDESFDVVMSNGVLNLVPDKDAAFREIARVLRLDGTFATADLLVIETVPEEVLADMDAWST
jgi:SAM-dependent methyltransferase